MSLPRKLTIKSLVLLIILVSLSACTPRREASIYFPLKDAGLQILSSTNPYHGPNVALAATLEESSSLAGYFQHKGAPRAIQVKTARTSQDKIILYYPDDYGMYVATRRGGLVNTPEHSEWMVAGPYRMNQSAYRQIKNFSRPREKSPVFLVHGNVTRYSQGALAYNTSFTIEPEVPLLPETESIEPPKKVVKKEQVEEVPFDNELQTGKNRDSLVNLDNPKFIPQNMDQQALALSSGYARRTSNGDIMHEVEGNAQMLENISDWYTGTTRNVSSIQDLSDLLPEQQEVRKGMIIRIPFALIKRTKKMPITHRATPETPIEENENKKSMGERSTEEG